MKSGDHIYEEGKNYIIYAVSDAKANSSELYLGYFFERAAAYDWLKDNMSKKFKFASLNDVMMSCHDSAVELVKDVAKREKKQEMYIIQNIGQEFMQFGRYGFTSDISIHNRDTSNLTIVQNGLNLLYDNAALFFSDKNAESVIDLIFTQNTHYLEEKYAKSVDIKGFLDLVDEKTKTSFINESFGFEPSNNYFVLDSYNSYPAEKSPYNRLFTVIFSDDSVKVTNLLTYLVDRKVIRPFASRGLSFQWKCYPLKRPSEIEESAPYSVRPLMRDSAYHNFLTHLDGGYDSSDSTINYHRPLFWLKPKKNEQLIK